MNSVTITVITNEEERKEKKRAYQREWRRRWRKTPKYEEYKKRPEVIAARRSWDRQPEHKQRAKENYKKRVSNPETLKKYHKTAAEYRRRPEVIAHLKAKRKDPKFKERKHERARESWKRNKSEEGNIASRRAMKQRLKTIKSGARRRGIDWKISDEYAWELLHKSCTYCGEEPEVYNKIQKQCATIDRIDNSLDYTVNNVTPSCLHCNRLKGARPLEEFLKMLREKKGKNWRAHQQLIELASSNNIDDSANRMGETNERDSDDSDSREMDEGESDKQF